jgi:hypothetical protein
MMLRVMSLLNAERRREAGTLLFLALVPTILFGDILFGANTLFLRDVSLYGYPGKRVLREIVLGGEFPFWSPYISAGQPLAANPVHQVFYPPTWLILLPDFTAGFNLLALLHVYLATFGMYALLRSMRVGHAAAAFGGLSFGIGGLIVSLLNLFALLYTVAWLPVTCLFTRRFLITRRRGDFIMAALSLGMQLLVGEPVTALQTGIILGAYAIHRGWREGGGRGAARAVAWIGAISMTALLLSSVQILPAIDHLRDSARGRGIQYAELTDWSAPPLRLAEPLFPAILGRWMLESTAVFPSPALFGGHAEPYFLSIYAGLAVGVFALAGLLARVRGWLLFAVLALLSAILALGLHTPLFRVLYETGTLRFIRYPEKFLAMGAFAAVVFSACVLERLLNGDRSVRRASLALAAAVSLIALSGAAAAAWLPAYASLLQRLYHIRATENIYGMIALAQKEWLFVALRGALLFVLVRSVMNARRTVWLALFFAFVLVDLSPQVPEIAPRFPRSFLEEEPPAVQRFPPNRADFRIFPLAHWIRASGQAPWQGTISDARYWSARSDLPQQSAGTYGLRTVIDGDIDVSDLRPERDFVSSVLELMRKEGRPADWMDIVMAMSNAWFVGVYRRPTDVAPTGRGGEPQPVWYLEGNHYPRYYFATELVTVRDRHEFVRALRSRRFSRQVAFVQQPAFVPASGTVSATRESANHARIEVEARGRAFLVMSVTPHKYWRITIDGNEVPAVVANIGYQGVVIPPGPHVVEMRYRNPLVTAGAAVSAATLLGLALIGLKGERRKDSGGPALADNSA